MAWVRPKHPKRKVEVDPTESLRPILEYFSCRPSASNSNNKEIMKVPKKQLLLLDSYRPRPQKRHYEELEQHQRSDHHHQRAEHEPRIEHHQRIDLHQRADDQVSDHTRSRASYHERASQRSTSHYTREPSPPPPPLPTYRSNARPGAHLRLMPSRHHITADTYIPRRPASSWASATTPLEM